MSSVSSNSTPTLEPDKFSATWVSHSSIRDFLNCPRYYFLNNVYKDPRTKHKITLMSPALALGQAVHEVVEALSILPTKERFNRPLHLAFEVSWKKVSGIKGGFSSKDQEQKSKERGLNMLKRIEANPGPLNNLAVKIQKDLPHYWLSLEETIILCGKIDWLEYFPDTDSVHIIDFKTGRQESEQASLQLPIYLLLASNCQKRAVAKASYWYLDLHDEPRQVDLPTLEEAYEKVIQVAREVRLARKLERFTCPQGASGCRYCQTHEKIIRGEATFVGTNDFNQDTYVLMPDAAGDSDSTIL